MSEANNPFLELIEPPQSLPYGGAADELAAEAAPARNDAVEIDLVKRHVATNQLEKELKLDDIGWPTPSAAARS